MRSVVLAVYAILSFISAPVAYMSPHATHDHSLTQPSKYAGGDGANQQLADDGGGGGNGNGAGNQES
jgi:hypothetical protein